MPRNGEAENLEKQMVQWFLDAHYFARFKCYGIFLGDILCRSCTLDVICS